MDLFIFLMEAAVIVLLLVSLLVKGETEEIVLYIAALILLASIIYNGVFVCGCVKSFFKKCA